MRHYAYEEQERVLVLRLTKEETDRFVEQVKDHDDEDKGLSEEGTVGDIMAAIFAFNVPGAL